MSENHDDSIEREPLRSRGFAFTFANPRTPVRGPLGLPPVRSWE